VDGAYCGDGGIVDGAYCGDGENVGGAYCGDGENVGGAYCGDGENVGGAYCGDGGIVDGANDGAAVLGMGVGALLGENVGDGRLTAGIVSDMMSPVAELHVGVV
jgi:hypothetical protein